MTRTSGYRVGAGTARAVLAKHGFPCRQHGASKQSGGEASLLAVFGFGLLLGLSTEAERSPHPVRHVTPSCAWALSDEIRIPVCALVRASMRTCSLSLGPEPSSGSPSSYTFCVRMP